MEFKSYVHFTLILTAFFMATSCSARSSLSEEVGENLDDFGDGNDQGTYPALLSRVQKSSMTEVMGCKKVPPLNIFKRLNSVCEDCFQLFRDQELYHMCRSDCFGSEYFLGCMDYLVYAKEHIANMAALVQSFNDDYVR